MLFLGCGVLTLRYGVLYKRYVPASKGKAYTVLNGVSNRKVPKGYSKAYSAIYAPYRHMLIEDV